MVIIKMITLLYQCFNIYSHSEPISITGAADSFITWDYKIVMV